MFEIGRVCLKIAGRDSNKYCVILEGVEDGLVLVDGQTRRKKVNVKHLEPTQYKLDVKEGADHSLVVERFSELDIRISLKKSKPATKRPKKQKVKKEKPVKKAKKAAKPKAKETKDDKKAVRSDTKSATSENKDPSKAEEKSEAKPETKSETKRSETGAKK